MSKLIPKTLQSDIPDLYETEGQLNPLCYVKLFKPTVRKNKDFWKVDFCFGIVYDIN